MLIGGTGDDILDGGTDDDTLLGGSGTDVLIGGDGDDLLMGGFGRDYISGGAGIDTLSYRGETRAVTVDLEAGLVRSDATENAVDPPSAALDVRGVSADTFHDTGVEDLIGLIEGTNRGSSGGVEFRSTGDIENIEGGLGSDTLLGDGQDNVIAGGKGDDTIDGRGGSDLARYSGSAADYDISLLEDGSIQIRHARNTSATSYDGVDTLRSIEAVEFADGQFALSSNGTLAAIPIAERLGISSDISIAAIECFDFVDLDQIDNSGSSGPATSSGSGRSDEYEQDDPDDAPDGLGSDTLYFADLDALFPTADPSMSTSLLSSDDLDYSSCTILALQAEIEAAMCLGELDDYDTLTMIDTINLKPIDCDPLGLGA
ncbi:MAG: calcium-binding protein [Sphingomonadales bacterium]|nr:calcium-binding protein [Sphingomonadales bacterium]